MFVFLFLCQLTRSGHSTTQSAMEMGQINTSVSSSAMKISADTSKLELLLQNEGVPYDDACKISKRMSYSSNINTIIHKFDMFNITLNQAKLQRSAKKLDFKAMVAVLKEALSRVSSRKSFVIKIKRQENKFITNVSCINAKTKVLATVTEKSWKRGIFGKKNVKTNIDRRPLTAEELEKINQAIDDKARPLIQKYSK